jgi:hypothetical protein
MGDDNEGMVQRVADIIGRQTDDGSRQPRFAQKYRLPWDYLPMALLADSEPPPYQPDSMRRDRWLRKAWRNEPHLSGVVSSVVLIDSNRGWEVSGGQRQVSWVTGLLQEADGGAGWRRFARKASLSFWTTDMGAVIELGRDGRGGPLAGVYHVDSARCRMTGDIDEPLEYHPSQGGMQRWAPDDFVRVVSTPSDDEAYADLGWCAVSRAVEVARLLYAVLVHDQELTAARAPRGLLLLSGITEEQWQDSLTARDATLDSLERRYYAGVQVLASAGMDNPQASLVALSQLPQNFDAKVFTDLCLYTYALCFGYDPSEFWPVQFGSLGRGTESEVQHAKATAKGQMAFPLELQDQLQRELPDTILFQFEERDDEGELTQATVQQAKLGVVTAAYEAGLTEGAPLLSREEARSLMAEAGLIPEKWTEIQEQTTETDTGEGGEVRLRRAAERIMDTRQVRAAHAQFPDERIVRYRWPINRLDVLYDPERTARSYVMGRAVRQDGDVLYEGDGLTITQHDVEEAVRKAAARGEEEVAQLMLAPTVDEEA